MAHPTRLEHESMTRLLSQQSLNRESATTTNLNSNPGHACSQSTETKRILCQPGNETAVPPHLHVRMHYDPETIRNEQKRRSKEQQQATAILGRINNMHVYCEVCS